MSKEMRRLIDTFNQHTIKKGKKSKYQLSIDKENERLLNLYPNLKFSHKWNSEMIPRYMETSGNSFEEEYNKWKIYYTKSLLEPFDIFYKKYRPDEQQMELLYSSDVKQQFDKIINGNLYVDVEFQTPSSPIRNYMKIISFDEEKLKNVGG